MKLSDINKIIHEELIKELGPPNQPVGGTGGGAQVAPTQQARPITPQPKTLPAATINTPEKGKDGQEASMQDSSLHRIQYQISVIKLRIGKMHVKGLLKRFVSSLTAFNNKITKNSEDTAEILSYVTPLTGDIQSLIGTLDALKLELDELRNIIEENTNV